VVGMVIVEDGMAGSVGNIFVRSQFTNWGASATNKQITQVPF